MSSYKISTSYEEPSSAAITKNVAMHKFEDDTQEKWFIRQTEYWRILARLLLDAHRLEMMLLCTFGNSWREKEWAALEEEVRAGLLKNLVACEAVLARVQDPLAPCLRNLLDKAYNPCRHTPLTINLYKRTTRNPESIHEVSTRFVRDCLHQLFGLVPKFLLLAKYLACGIVESGKDWIPLLKFVAEKQDMLIIYADQVKQWIKKFDENSNIQRALVHRISREEYEVWVKSYSHQNCLLSSQVATLTWMRKPSSELELESYVLPYLNLYQHNEKDLSDLLLKLTRYACEPDHVYLICGAIREKFGSEFFSLVTQLHVRALNFGLADRERLRITADAPAFLAGQHRLAADRELNAECVLTAFCLNPSEHYLGLLEECYNNLFMQLRNKRVMCEDRDKLQLLSRETPHKKKTSKEKFMYMVYQRAIAEKMKTNIAWGRLLSGVLIDPSLRLVPTSLRLERVLRCDLAELLSGPRYKELSWDLSWNEMDKICKGYIKSTAGGTKAPIDEMEKDHHGPTRSSSLYVETGYFWLDGESEDLC